MNEPLLSIEEEIFQKRTVDFSSLEKFGFRKEPDGRYTIVIPFMDGEFRAEIEVSPDGTVTGRVMDVAAEEEYLPVRIRSRAGAFVGEVRLRYAEILQSVADACCTKEYFIYPQSNRITNEIFQRYGESPDFPFSTATSYGVFRLPSNRKWYGLIMQILKGKLTGPEDPEGEKTVEVLNVKVAEETLAETLKIPGVYPCYHMNKANWVSVLLDGTLNDGEILRLVDGSRNAVLGKKAGRPGRTCWIVPSNPSYYDIDAAFREEKEITWKQGRGIKVGDIAYMYLASPYSEIRYRCEVTATMIPFSYRDKNVSMSHLMKIRLLETYPEGTFPFSKMRACGVKMIRGPLQVPEALQAELDAYGEKT